jgi:hypothetical protein
MAIGTRDKLIERIFRKYCTGMVVDNRRINPLFNMALVILQAGASHEEIGVAMLKCIGQKA